MMVAGLLPRLIQKKKMLRVLFSLCGTLCDQELPLFENYFWFFRRYSFMQVLYFMQSCTLGTQEKSAPRPRSRARESSSMFLTVHWENFMLLFGICEVP